jgi:hypothetical protein
LPAPGNGGGGNVFTVTELIRLPDSGARFVREITLSHACADADEPPAVNAIAVVIPSNAFFKSRFG